MCLSNIRLIFKSSMFESMKIICRIVRQGELRQCKIDIAGSEKIGKAASQEIQSI
jgi:hypothetical protein